MARKKPAPRGPQLKLAGALAVAFVNTAGARHDNRQLGVTDYAELLVWAQQAGVASASEAEGIARRAAGQPEEAEAIYGGAVSLRNALFRIFVSVMAGKESPPADLGAVNQALAAAMPALRLVPGENGITWGWADDGSALDRMLWPVLHSAAQLLTSLEGRPHVRQCAAEECTLFFVDRTPSGHRRWCEMKTCGHRTHALRYYHDTAKPERKELEAWSRRRTRR